MGDAADDLTDSMEFAMFFDDGFDDPDEFECKYCGTVGLHWEQTDRGWRLFDDEGNIHTCKERQNGSV